MFGRILDFLSRNKFHGVNLNRWHYLGRSTINYVDKKTNIVQHTEYLYSFCLKKNTSERRYVMNNSFFSEHYYYRDRAPLWAMGEYPLYALVNDMPSTWLKQYMLDNNKVTWDNKEKMWVPSVAQEVTTNSDNVVNLFAKKGLDKEV